MKISDKGGDGVRNDRNDKALLIFFAAGLLLCFTLAVFFPAPRFSERENRNLTEKPRFSLPALANGTWETETDTYLTERFCLRTGCRALRAVTELTEGKREVSGIILGSDGSLLRRGNASPRTLAANLNGVRRLSESAEERGVPFTVAAVPRAVDVRADVLPALYLPETGLYQTLSETLPGALSLTELNGSGDFYATDHHLTTAGAFRAYLALCPSLEITPYTYEDFEVTCVSTAFAGTSDAAAGIPGVRPDKIELYRFAGDEKFIVTRDGAPAAFTGFYDTEKLARRDQYAVFLGGNAGVTEVRQGEDDPRPVLLLYRDSYGNALIPFLARHFRILAVDPRYTSAPLSSFLDGADLTLVFCGMQSLSETTMFR